MRALTSASQVDRADTTAAAAADAEERALHDVVQLLVRQESTQGPERLAQIRGWVHETADQFDEAPVKNYVPILVEHIVRDRMYRSPDYEVEMTAARAAKRSGTALS